MLPSTATPRLRHSSWSVPPPPPSAPVRPLHRPTFTTDVDNRRSPLHLLHARPWLRQELLRRIPLAPMADHGCHRQSVVPPLALIASGAHFLNSYMTHTQPQHYRFMAAGVLSLAILPYTFMALGPTNAELASREEKKENSPDYGLRNLDVKELINRWSNRSAVRGFLLLASTIVSYDAMLHLTF